MSAQKPKRALEILVELLNLTRKMSKSDDPDFIVEAIDKRGELMAEYDALKASNPEAAELIEKNQTKISEMLGEIVEHDKKINRALFSMYHEAKTNLQSSNKNKQILKYTNQAISASGSYMDYKE